MLAQKAGERLRQMLRQARGVGEEMHARPHTAGKAGEIAAHGVDLVDDEAGVIEQALASRGQLHAAAPALEQRNTERLLEPLDARARRGQGQVRALRAAGDAALVGDCDEELEVNEVEAHGGFSSAFAQDEGCLRNLQIVPGRGFGQCAGMIDPLLIVIAAVFLVAGFVKGVVGLGLPTVSMGLLAVSMAPSRAIAIVIVPAIVTNIWQTFVGPHLRDILRRLWPLMIGTVIGCWLNAGALTGPHARYGTIVLGVLLMIYAVIGLNKFHFRVAPQNEKWVGGVVGVVTGVISASTGVQVIPSMPFMQAIGMEKDELVQALGVFFTTATLALAFNLTAGGLLTPANAVPGAVGMACAFAGMFIGQSVRARMPAEAFRRWFLIAMILLGLYLAGSALAKEFA
ncbi:putative membrane protein YfcA [Bradyrhizobium sp. LM2.7]